MGLNQLSDDNIHYTCYWPLSQPLDIFELLEYLGGASCPANTSRLKFHKTSRTVYLEYSCLLLGYFLETKINVELQQSTIQVNFCFLLEISEN